MMDVNPLFCLGRRQAPIFAASAKPCGGRPVDGFFANLPQTAKPQPLIVLLSGVQSE
jgi:hypothetical protein